MLGGLSALGGVSLLIYGRVKERQMPSPFMMPAAAPIAGGSTVDCRIDQMFGVKLLA